MSWEVTGLISRRKIGSQTRRLLLLTMGDKANDDGSGIYASVATLARDSEISESSVRRTVKDFLTEGLLRHVGQRECRNGYTNIYEIVLEAIEALPEIKRKPDTPVTVKPLSPRTPAKAKALPADTPATVTPDPCHGDSPTPVTVTAKPIQKPIQEPTLALSGGGGPKGKGGKSPTAYPADFEAFWKSWPRTRRENSDKRTAARRWTDARKRWPAETLMLAATRYLSKPETRKEDYRYCVLAEVFLNGKLEAAVEAVQGVDGAKISERDQVWMNGRWCWPDGKPVEERAP